MSVFETFHSFSHIWNFFFNYAIISPSLELSLPLESVKLNIFLFIAPLVFLNFSFGCYICNNFLMKSGDSSNDSRVLFKEETMWVCSVLRLQVMSYSEPETTASFPKLPRKRCSHVTFVTDCLSFLNTSNLFYHSVQHRSQVFLWTCAITDIQHITTLL
jgi:hypothetical protein